MAVKERKVPVIAKDGTQWEFGVEQAEALIVNYGWRLADNCSYIYDRENGIRFKPNTRPDKSSEQERDLVENEDGATPSEIPHGGK